MLRSTEVAWRAMTGKLLVGCAGLSLLSPPAPAQSSRGDSSATYRVRVDEPQQIIKGLGFEIQSDSIGSGNAGMPEEVAAVPHDLTPSERQRFYTQMVHGFRYTRLAMGLYLRGNDAEKKHIIERYAGQMDDLRTMQEVSGIEGFDVEYWSPAPYWKKNKSYYGGTIANTDPEFVDQFTDALVDDLRYLNAHGLKVAMWGLQNEPVIDLSKKANTEGLSAGKAQSYATCYYSPRDYATVLKAAIPKVRSLLPDVQVHAPSLDGQSGQFAAEIRKDPALLKGVDAWSWHAIGRDANEQIDLQKHFMQDADGKPVYQNEFEYQPWGGTKMDAHFMNTGQSIMNWMVFENSPTWFWLHALKPVTNMEATGYALGFWRPEGEVKNNLRPDLPAGHWEFNPSNWNAIAGFLKYLAWDSTRLTVDESIVEHDQRILVWRTKSGKLGIALSNRGDAPFTFKISGVRKAKLIGHRYTLAAIDQPLGTKLGVPQLELTVQPQSFEFWIER